MMGMFSQANEGPLAVFKQKFKISKSRTLQQFKKILKLDAELPDASEKIGTYEKPIVNKSPRYLPLAYLNFFIKFPLSNIN